MVGEDVGSSTLGNWLQCMSFAIRKERQVSECQHSLAFSFLKKFTFVCVCVCMMYMHM